MAVPLLMMQTILNPNKTRGGYSYGYGGSGLSTNWMLKLAFLSGISLGLSVVAGPIAYALSPVIVPKPWLWWVGLSASTFVGSFIIGILWDLVSD